jgi:hypothetical protein
MVRFSYVRPSAMTGQMIDCVEPGNSFGKMEVRFGFEPGGIVERADVKIDNLSQRAADAFPGERRAAIAAEAANNARRRTVSPAGSFYEAHLLRLEYGHGDNRRAGMAAAAFAMAETDRDGRSRDFVSNSSAHAAAGRFGFTWSHFVNSRITFGPREH